MKRHFVIISGLGWLLDISLMLLLVQLGVHLFVANSISAFCAVTFVFFLARSQVFKDAPVHSLNRTIVIYWLWQVVAINAASGLIVLVDMGLFFISYKYFSPLAQAAEPLAKILVTPVTLAANFIFIKWLFTSPTIHHYGPNNV